MKYRKKKKVILNMRDTQYSVLNNGAVLRAQYGPASLYCTRTVRDGEDEAVKSEIRAIIQAMH